ncbi:hypothetical protein RHMOL_Rhmol06G0167900 [Rhododendron molle]|uniref:Uncharacterized protein n=1 Tax=Rhododendron molle TaxID=49168 RepID=A0ACC0NDC9_RHOML|nr:hypothetical protein RHMOL_Rhmol06G0167900 [Rhododendron molle]
MSLPSTRALSASFLKRSSSWANAMVLCLSSRQTLRLDSLPVIERVWHHPQTLQSRPSRWARDSKTPPLVGTQLVPFELLRVSLQPCLYPSLSPLAGPTRPDMTTTSTAATCTPGAAVNGRRASHSRARAAHRPLTPSLRESTAFLWTSRSGYFRTPTPKIFRTSRGC